MAVLLGITGTIGSGKSTIGSILASQGITVIDTDAIVHELLSGSEEIQKIVLDRFGTIDRKELGALVFENAKSRRDLEAILHPAVLSVCRTKAKVLQAEPLIAFLVPLLFEARLEKEYDQIWTVVVDENILRQRLKERNNYSDSELTARLSSQFPQETKARLANQVINNSGSVHETKAQIDRLISLLLSESPG